MRCGGKGEGGEICLEFSAVEHSPPPRIVRVGNCESGEQR